MCILIIAVNAHPSFPFICLHNRDEVFSRETTDPDAEDPVICGRDQQSGGTWMGLHKATGNFVSLTNYRSIFFRPPPNYISRGVLVQRFLEDQGEVRRAYDAAARGQRLTLGASYPGFNLFCCNLLQPGPVHGLFLSNRPHITLPAALTSRQPVASRKGYVTHFGCSDSDDCAGCVDADEKGKTHADRAVDVHRVSQGIHCVSNGMFDDVRWPKVAYLKWCVTSILRTTPEVDEVSLPQGDGDAGADSVDAEMLLVQTLLTQLASCLSYKEPFPDHLLPDLSFTSETKEEEAVYQSVFLRHHQGKGIPPLEDEGTRSQTIVIRSHKRVYYFYRNTDQFPTLPEWTLYTVDIPQPQGSPSKQPVVQPKVDTRAAKTAVLCGVLATAASVAWRIWRRR